MPDVEQGNELGQAAQAQGSLLRPAQSGAPLLVCTSLQVPMDVWVHSRVVPSSATVMSNLVQPVLL